MAEGFGARVKAYRRRAGLTQQALALRAGLSVSTVARLEQGGAPAADTVATLERSMGAPPGTLGATDEPDGLGESLPPRPPD